MCVLVRHLPALNPSLPAGSGSTATTPSSLPGRLPAGTQLSEDTTQLLCSALTVLTDLLPLCSPAGKLNKNLV